MYYIKVMARIWSGQTVCVRSYSSLFTLSQMWLLYSDCAGNLYFFWHVLKAFLWGQGEIIGKYLPH